MKILNIRFNNINSLKGEHHINFTKPPFDTSPLFAITGPTGSGKSTLLDVISLALFNQVPRLGKISKKEIQSKGALLTRNQKEAFASVTYQCNAGIFTSIWSISTNRKNRLRDYEMEIADEAGKVLDVKRSGVAAHNEKLIGLNYDQFIKSVLLAQGEFAQFLKAKKDEQGELLEKITGTGIYRDLGRKAYERFKKEARTIEKQQDEIATHQSELLDDASLKDTNEKFGEKKKRTDELEKQIKQLEKNIELKLSLAKTQRELEVAVKNQSSEQDKMNQFLERSGSLLSGHEKVRPVADELRAWSSVQDNLTKLEKQRADLLAKSENNRKAGEVLLQDTIQFIGKKTNGDNAEKDIDSFAEEVRALQKKKEEETGKYKELVLIIKEQSRETAFEFSPNADNIQTIQRLQSNSEDEAKRLSKELDINFTHGTTAYREVLKEKLRRSLQLEKEKIVLDQEQKNLSRKKSEMEQVKSLKESLPKEIELAEAKAKQFEAEASLLLKSLENQRLRASLEEHRAKLKNDEPCPLCGSLDHPFAEHLPEEENTESELDRLRKTFKERETVFISKKAEFSKLTAQEKELQQIITSVEEVIKNLTEKESKLSEGLDLELGTTWEENTKAIQDKLETLTHLENEKKLLSSYREIHPKLEKLITIIQAGKKIKSQLQQKYGGENINGDTQNLLKRWNGLLKEDQLIDDQLKDFKKEIKLKKEKNQSLEQFLCQAESLKGCQTLTEALNLLLDERTFDKLQGEKIHINNAIRHFDSTIKVLTNQLADLKNSEITESLELLHEKFEKKEIELEETRKTRNELERRITNHEEKARKIADKKQQIAMEEKRLKRWKLLNEIIGDAKGKRFNDFAQDLTLRHLVALANVRLVDLSDRYRLDTPNEDDDDSLIILDDHMGSQRRSVRTLSGGETFLLSLSMALALSDLASKNVEINSLFIDEGFGTLDPETLDQTLDTLEKLQSEASKTIGIISHVDSLKERIATQIQLERNGQGYSTLRII